ncbi:type II toxin-antitoxin system Phd/YefM family antitoxin [uncultured Gilvimarinus sp.]|uniref:type II toxin-antitoxin system Phd/YefM family antitoxin n=1 Tax=uncultured Gilvimarinus sp. TaxID=1689143 RepID=UPI0030D6DEEB
MLSSRQFNQHASEAKKKALEAPVFITDRGKPSHVLMSIDEYNRLTGQPKIADLLAMPGVEDIELPIDKSTEAARAADMF